MDTASTTLGIHERRNGRVPCSVLFPAVELAEMPNKTGLKIIPLSSLQETAFLSYSNHRRASNPTMESENMTFKEIQNDLASKHSSLTVEVKDRTTGRIWETSVAELIRKAESFDAWYDLTEPETRTIGRLDDFLCDYTINWS